MCATSETAVTTTSYYVIGTPPVHAIATQHIACIAYLYVT